MIPNLRTETYYNGDRWSVYGVLLAFIWGLLAAYTSAWLCDDAFISFRYARNLVEGLGLVFNAGERVEGYTNFLWTIWIALGLVLGYTAEFWAQLWGIVCYAASLSLLIVYHFRLRDRLSAGSMALPVAALGSAFHFDWNVYATSGLETSLYTFLLLAGYMLLVAGSLRSWHVIASGVLFALASLTRPEGVLFAGMAGLFMLWFGQQRLRHSFLYWGGFVALWLPFILWRLGYYGELVPNTYYAKSADLTWYTQGWHYILLYFRRYWALLLGPFLLLHALSRRHTRPSLDMACPLNSQALLAAAFALSYTFYIMRLGGDFMFARMLIPVAPFYLILIEIGLLRMSITRPLSSMGLALLVCVGLLLSPSPVTDTKWIHGIANEWMYYSPVKNAETDHRAAVLQRYFQGLPVRVALLGAEARLAYHARIPVAIESETGLTDYFIARQPLTHRGRVGHEKHAPVPYLIDQRKVHFIFHPAGDAVLRLSKFIPISKIMLDEIEGYILHWDPPVMEVLKRRGATFEDFPTSLDRYITRIDTLPDDAVKEHFAKFNRFYFDHVTDLDREKAFRARLSREHLPLTTRHLNPDELEAPQTRL